MIVDPDTFHSDSDQRGSANTSAEPRFLIIGRVIKPHGIRGEVRIEVHSDVPDRFSQIEYLFLAEDEKNPVKIDHVRYHQKWVLLKLRGVDDRNAAESLRKAWLYIRREDTNPLEENEYYLFQIIGLKVVNQEGVVIGEVRDILETQANNVFVVDGAQKEYLIPDIPEVIKEISFATGIIEIDEMPGLLS